LGENNSDNLQRLKRDDDTKSDTLKVSDLKGSNKEESHSHISDSNSSHSSIGVTLVLGFVFMLIVDQIGGKLSHQHAGLPDHQATRNKISFSTTLGLVVHAAADGIALGAASATSKVDVEMIVFLAIMLHKAPAAFGLVSFLIHEGLDKQRIRKHLIIFSLAAPLMAILTFTFLKSVGLFIIMIHY
jgi:solute carrier family 39 (zinc transporter), member 9